MTGGGLLLPRDNCYLQEFTTETQRHGEKQKQQSLTTHGKPGQAKGTKAAKIGDIAAFKKLVPNQISGLRTENRERLSQTNFASIVISAFKTFETGHPLLAFWAAFSNAALSPPGILAATSR